MWVDSSGSLGLQQSLVGVLPMQCVVNAAVTRSLGVLACIGTCICHRSRRVEALGPLDPAPYVDAVVLSHVDLGYFKMKPTDFELFNHIGDILCKKLHFPQDSHCTISPVA